MMPGSQLLSTIAQTMDPRARSTEYGNIPESLAYRVPGLRGGLPVKHDVLGREAGNEYAGVYAWLPFRAVNEELNNTTLQTPLSATAGAPTPPTYTYSPPQR